MSLLTCSTCDTKWSGVSRAHCSACHQTFAAFGLFDLHRRLTTAGVGTCLDPEGIMRTSKKTGEKGRVMFRSDGIWRAVEDPQPNTGANLRQDTPAEPFPAITGQPELVPEGDRP